MTNKPMTIPPIGAEVRFVFLDEDRGTGEVVGFGTMTQHGNAWPVVLVEVDSHGGPDSVEVWLPSFLEIVG